MSKNFYFSFKFIMENKITKVKMANMPVEQHLELEFDDNGSYIPPAKWIIGNVYYNLPLRSDTIPSDEEVFAFVDLNTFGDYLLSELNYCINKHPQ